MYKGKIKLFDVSEGENVVSDMTPIIMLSSRINPESIRIQSYFLSKKKMKVDKDSFLKVTTSISTPKLEHSLMKKKLYKISFD
jgi:hypothetical protein